MFGAFLSDFTYTALRFERKCERYNLGPWAQLHKVACTSARSPALAQTRAKQTCME